VTAIGKKSITFKHVESGREVTWNDGSLKPKGEPRTDVCKGGIQRLAASARWGLYETVLIDNDELPLFSLGGGVNCSDRWKVDGLPAQAITVMWHRDGFWLAPGVRRYDVLMSRKGVNARFAFTDLSMPVMGSDGTINSLIVGRTRYRVRFDDRAFKLTPVLNNDFWPSTQAIPSNFIQKSWIGDGTGAITWLTRQAPTLSLGVGAAVVAVLLLWWFWQRKRDREVGSLLHTVAGVAPAIIGIWLTMILRTGRGAPDDVIAVAMVWVAWFWATIMLVWSRRLFGLAGSLWVIAIFLAMAGTITLMQLAAGADNSWWLGFIRKHAVLLALYGWGISILAAVPMTFFNKLWLWLFDRESIWAAAGIVLVGLMMLQLIAGGEEGIAGIQPVEIMKSVLVVLLGFAGLHITETRRRGTRAYRRSPLLFILPYLRLVGLVLVAVLIIVVGVRDFSPIVILGVLLLAWLWKLGRIERTEKGAAFFWRWIRPLVLLFIIGFIAGGYYIHQHPDELPSSFPQRDRILVWAQPERHQHSGSQVLRAMDNVASGGWRGEGSWFGINGPVLTVPAVQDDFITAFFLHKFGGIAGLVLLGFQLAYLIVLFRLSRAVQLRTSAGDFGEQNAGMVMSYAVYGLAVMQITHWMIAWGNSLGLLPVMGQPMTWLSAGNSHLLGFALLTLTIGLITSWFARARI
jgi:cell division protein FtsW